MNLECPGVNIKIAFLTGFYPLIISMESIIYQELPVDGL